MPAHERSVPRSVVPVLEALELDQPMLVTREHLEQLALENGVSVSVTLVARLLQERGWLLPLRTRGVWEFAPGARAGAYGGGDPFIELRARLLTRPIEVAVAAESAAWRLGLLSRSPDRHVIALPTGHKVPRSLDGFRVVHWNRSGPPVVVDELPVWSVNTLVAFMGSKPSQFRDWPNVSEWLSDARRLVDVDTLRSELAKQSRSGWARTSYLLSLAGATSAAQELMASAPPGAGTFHLGPRDRPSRYDAQFDVADHIFSNTWSIKAR